MTTLLSRTLAAALLSLGLGAGPIWAQTTTTEGTATAETETEAPADPGGLQPGEKYVLDEQGDFQIRCIKTEGDAKDACQLYQLLKNASGASVAEFTLLAIPQNPSVAAGVTIITPLETLLTKGVTFSIDANEPTRHGFGWCNTLGCYTQFPIDETRLSQLKAGSAAKVVIVPVAAPDQTVDLTVSLRGFTAGFARLTEIAAE